MSGENPNSEAILIATLRSVLQIADSFPISASTRLLGGIAEFDSLAVASVIVGIEEQFGLEFDEEDLHAEIFATVGTLSNFVEKQKNQHKKTEQTTQPVYVTAQSGKLFAINHNAAGQVSRCVIFVPPFAEEMNRSRELATSTAKSINSAGISCCVFDLSGTGDSAGNFCDARWATWLSDLHAIVKKLRSEGYVTIDLVAIRLGALLAVDYIATYAAEIGRLVVWDPVFDGADFVNKFLRIRSMAAMIDGSGESVKFLRGELESGNSVEVAGYELHPQMAAALQTHNAQQTFMGANTPLYWIACKEDKAVSETATRVGCKLMQHQVAEYSAYWSTAESTDAAALTQATLDCLTAS